MSVINEVLTQLEQRGMQPAPEQTMVRAVTPTPRFNFVLPVMIAGTVLFVLVAVWHSLHAHKPNVAKENVAAKQPVVAANPVASGVVAVPAAIVKTPVEQMPVPAARPGSGASSVPASAPAREAVAKTGSTQTEKQQVSRACIEPCQKAVNVPKAPAPAVAITNAVMASPNKTNVQAAAPAAAPAPLPMATATSATAPVPVKRVSPAQQAEAEYRKAVALMQQGRSSEAIEGYEATLRLDSGHEAARRALVALLLENKRTAEAEHVLQEALQNKPERTGFAMLLARLQVDRGAIELATATLEKSLPYADAQADYQAFFAALLQRQNRHKEAITHYQLALQLAPGNGIWLMGYGISLQAVQRNEEARDAYRRALESKTLSPELQAFVQQKLRSL
ncbi:MAG TPA: tetratricopeptide repeat protein [Gallionella sp.]|nr:tetratricopeptide repeat protein [Gallionella sp.]